MIGCGGRCSGAANQALSLGKDVKLVGMCDVFQKRMEARRKLFQRMYPDQFVAKDDTCTFGLDGYKAVIAASDAVLIACASKYHSFYAEEAVKAGKHVFVEKPQAIDPAGCIRLRRACELAKQKNVSVISGLESRYSLAHQELVKRIHDGAIGKVVAIQSMFLRGPYQTVQRDPELTETQYQFSNWYHFCWLSGDDVPQSLVHNMDRVAWILKEEMPAWCFALAGRSTSFGEVYGDMFDHHSVVYEYARGTRVYALCQTRSNTYGNASDIVMGSKGTCNLGACRIDCLGDHRIDGEKQWQFKGPHNNPYDAEQKALIDAVVQGKPINSGYHMANSTLSTVMGQIACYQGSAIPWDRVAKSQFEWKPSADASSFQTPPPVKPDATGNYPLPVPGVTKLV